jgi:thiol:disulfide interchange protein
MWTWETNAADARSRARREHLPLVIYLRADWSAGAIEMDRNVWSDPRVLFQKHAIVSLRLDLTGGPDAELWAEEYRVAAIPSTIFIDAEGHEVTRLEGSRSVEEVLTAMRAIEDR